MLEYDNKVYINNPKTGVLIFDIYGTYYKTVPVKDLNYFQPLGDRIYYQKDSCISSYNIKTTEEITYQLPTKNFSSFCLHRGILFVQQEDKIYIYSEQ